MRRRTRDTAPGHDESHRRAAPSEHSPADTRDHWGDVGNKAIRAVLENAGARSPAVASLRGGRRKEIAQRLARTSSGPSTKRAVLQRFEEIGTERWEGWRRMGGPGTSTHREDTAWTTAVKTGEEGEWRRALDNSFWGGSDTWELVGAFLRAALLSDSALRSAAEAGRVEWFGGDADHATGVRRELSGSVGDPEKMAFAKALYLRGTAEVESHIDRGVNSWLLERFISEYQAEMIRRLAQHEVGYTPGSAEPAATAVGDRGRAAMIGSALQSMLQGIARYAEGRSDTSLEAAEHEVRYSGYTIRGVIRAAGQIREEKKDLYDSIVGGALGAIPIPGGSIVEALADVFMDQVKSAVVNALVSDDENRMDTVLREVHRAINDLEAHGVAYERRRELRDMVDSSLM